MHTRYAGRHWQPNVEYTLATGYLETRPTSLALGVEARLNPLACGTMSQARGSEAEQAKADWKSGRFAPCQAILTFQNE